MANIVVGRVIDIAPYRVSSPTGGAAPRPGLVLVAGVGLPPGPVVHLATRAPDVEHVAPP